jgi:hypothetical protein
VTSCSPGGTAEPSAGACADPVSVAGGGVATAASGIGGVGAFIAGGGGGGGGFGASGITVRCGACVGPGAKFSPLPTDFTFGPHSWLRRFMIDKRSVSRMWNRPSARRSAPVVWIAA